jgi:hypothetical protein
MKCYTITSLLAATTLVSAAPTVFPRAVRRDIPADYTTHNFPVGPITCPVPMTANTVTFSTGYAARNMNALQALASPPSQIKSIYNNYPKEWDVEPGDVPIDLDCTWEGQIALSETPMYMNRTTETYWTDTKFANSSDPVPGPYRMYYILDTEAKTAKWCGALAHYDYDPTGNLVKCEYEMASY